MTLSTWFWYNVGDNDRKSVDANTLIEIFISQTCAKLLFLIKANQTFILSRRHFGIVILKKFVCEDKQEQTKLLALFPAWIGSVIINRLDIAQNVNLQYDNMSYEDIEL